MSRELNTLAKFVVFAIGIWGSIGAIAQSGPVIEELIVTAERRAASSQDVPVAVHVVSGEAIENTAITDLAGIQNMVPSLVITDNTGFVLPSIRGVGSSVFGQGVYSSVATYVDGVYIARLTSGTFDLDNVESIQVLAGPQGALYGRNASAGAIVVTTKTAQPGDEFSGRVSATVGNYNNKILKARFMGSLSDNVAFTLSGQMNQRDGYIENLNPIGFGAHQDDLNDRDSQSFSGALSFNASDAFSGVLRASYFESDDLAHAGYQAVGQDIYPGFFGAGLNSNQTMLAAVAASLGLTGPQAVEVGATAIYSDEIGTAYDPHLNSRDVGGALVGSNIGPGSSSYIEVSSLSLSLEYDFDSFVAKSHTSYVENKYVGATSVTGEGPGTGFTVATPDGDIFAPMVGGIGFTGDFPTDTLSQELIIDSAADSDVVWTIGAVYFSEDGKTDLTGDFFGAGFWSARNDFDVEALSGYAQVTFPLNDLWSLTGGLRHTKEEYSIFDRVDPTEAFAFPGLPNFNFLLEPFENDSTTYTARVQRDAGDWMAYAGVSTGFKSGSMNPGNPAAGTALPEDVTSYEIGVKTDLRDNVRFNLAAYQYDYENSQVNILDTGTGSTTLANVADSEVNGIDLELVYAATDSVTFDVSATFLDAEYKSDGFLGSGASLLVEGNKLVAAPDFAANLSMDWVLPVNSEGSFVFNVDYAYNDGFFFEPENRVGTGGASAEDYSLVNASLNYSSADEQLEITVWGKNILDEDYYRSGIYTNGLSLLGIAGNPATYGVTAAYNF